MHSVKRIEKEPESLKNNKKKWTEDLLHQLEMNKGKISKVDEQYKNQYKQDDVKEALKEMYGELCCYCEGNISLTGYEEIEHYRPKSKYPELCFEWSNLHQVCKICNVIKNNKWDEDYPILCPTDDKIENHLFYKNILLMCENDNKRAINTIKHLKLNEREELLNYRTRLLKKALECSKKTEAEKAIFKDILMDDERYSTFKKYLVSIIDGANSIEK